MELGVVANIKRKRQDAVVDETAAVTTVEKVAVRPAGEETPGIESPARRLQAEIEQSWAAPETRRWTARRTVAFVVVSNVILWAAIIAGVRAIF
jgi:hypothetical protein